MQIRRFMRLTNAFAKKLKNRAVAIALLLIAYNMTPKHKAVA
jgi:hypothetical protein